MYELLADEMAASAGVATGFTQLLSASSEVLLKDQLHELRQHGRVILRYFETIRRLFYEALSDDGRQELVPLLLGDAPAHLGADFHKALPERIRLAVPLYFRTDESRLGNVLEIQCPGSLWGDHRLVAMAATEMGIVDSSLQGLDLTAAFASSLTDLVSKSGTIVHHLIDNSSAPHTARYFIADAAKRCGVPHYGVSPDVGARDCNFVRSHSVYGLAAENFFHDRVSRKEVVFDLPPSLVFDQKAPLSLPFEVETRDEFDDEIRNLLAFTSVVKPEGLLLPGTDKRIGISDFARLPRRSRRYYLKYAGTDVAKNWGSMAVYSLERESQEKCLARLTAAADDFAKGCPWVIQEADEVSYDETWLTRGSDPESRTLDSKYSRFFGGHEMLGALRQGRKFYKVHGQRDTVVRLVAWQQD